MQFTPWDTRWEPTASSSSSTRPPIPQHRCALRSWASPHARHRHKSVTLYRRVTSTHHQCRTGLLVCAAFARLHVLRSARLRSGSGWAAAYPPRTLNWALGDSTPSRADGTEYPGDQRASATAAVLRRRWRGKNGAAPRLIGDISIYDVDFRADRRRDGAPAWFGLTMIDHLTHNVHRGACRSGAEFYERLFNFRSALFRHRRQAHRTESKAMTSPCGKIRIRSRELDDKSQIAEYLDLTTRGTSTWHWAPMTSTRPFRRCRPMASPSRHARNLLRLVTSACRTMRAPRRPQATADPDRWRRHPGAPTNCCCNLHAAGHRSNLLRADPSARATRASARGNFRALFESIEPGQIRRACERRGSAA